MSRIGRMPIAIPAGTTVTVENGNVVTVKGKLGTPTCFMIKRAGLFGVKKAPV